MNFVKFWCFESPEEAKKVRNRAMFCFIFVLFRPYPKVQNKIRVLTSKNNIFVSDLQVLRIEEFFLSMKGAVFLSLCKPKVRQADFQIAITFEPVIGSTWNLFCWKDLLPENNFASKKSEKRAFLTIFTNFSPFSGRFWKVFFSYFHPQRVLRYFPQRSGSKMSKNGREMAILGRKMAVFGVLLTTFNHFTIL